MIIKLYVGIVILIDINKVSMTTYLKIIYLYGVK